MRAERLARSGTYSLIGSSFAAVAALVLTVLVGNGLGTHGTGLFFQAVGVFSIASHVLRLGTNTSVVKMLSEQRALGRTGEAWRYVVIAVVPVLLAAVVAAITIALFSVELAGWLAAPPEQDAFAGLLRDMAPYLVLASVLSVLGTVTRMMRGVAAFTVIQSILLPLSRLLVVAMVIVLTAEAFDVFRGWLAVVPLWLVVTIAVLARPLLLDWRQRGSVQTPMRVAAGRFWRFSGSRAVGGTFEIALEWSDVLIVAALASPAEAGIYAVATRVVRAGQVVDGAMRVAVGPTISELLANANIAAARRLHTRVTRAMILANWPFYLILATMGPALLQLFGDEFRGGAVVLAILAGAMMVAAAAGMLQSVLLQGGKSSWQMYNKGLALVISVGLNLLLVPVLGITGAALTWATCVLVDTSIASFQVHRRMGVQLEPRKLLLAMTLPFVVFGIGGVALRVLVGPSSVILIGGVGLLVVIYLVALWSLRGRLEIESLWMQVPLVRRFARPVPSSAPGEEVHERTS